jgi:hypothetical protein
MLCFKANTIKMDNQESTLITFYNYRAFQNSKLLGKEKLSDYEILTDD